MTMEEEEKRIEKAEQEKDRKNEKSPSGKEKMRKKSSQENVLKENFSQFKIFGRCGLDQTDSRVPDTNVSVTVHNKTLVVDSNNEKLVQPLECANR